MAEFELKISSSSPSILDDTHVLVHHGHCLFDARQFRKLSDVETVYPSSTAHKLSNVMLNWNLLFRKAQLLGELDLKQTLDDESLAERALSLVSKN
ncbi:uncharacterized protein UV8b_01017 [Ustilaginoidea virens]|uniref:Uncharacterized protein n=1 Tax=Ustilaginoidea virens TaxID=1159556 RepID=A0A8E5MEV5_USTVR|nr:uncharacterized protein UV8b_01017 [Ustilaginoidea virens]QUC16776.1 hypothetical protein UV8b_01017 [Ustilaginoidea virens]